MKNLLHAILFFLPCWVLGQTVSVSGYMTDENSGEALIYATVYIEGTSTGTTTNEYGFYSIEISQNDSVDLVFSYTGYHSKVEKLLLTADFSLNVQLTTINIGLEEVVIVADKDKITEKVQSTQMSTVNLPVNQIKNLPSIGGEVDIIKVMQLLPGVSKGGEGTSGMFVRGGDADQNLVLLDEATVYNIGHLFGFFSVFNPDAINDMTMIKGAFPANYGGRLSSVLDIRMKEGNDKEYHAEGGIGLLSSRLMLEGPIIKEKASFLISGRRTYIDQVFKAVGSNLPYYFYDLNAKVNWKISETDRIFVSTYFGDDVLDVSETVVDSTGVDTTGVDTTVQPFSADLDFGFGLGNFTQSVRWNHIFSPKLFSNLTLTHTNFRYNIFGNFLGNSILIKSRIRDIGLKLDFTKFKSNTTTFKYGGQIINHNFRPNIVSTAGLISEALASREGDLQSTLELAAYADAAFDWTDWLRIQGGMRISSSFVKDGAYLGPEPRLAARFKLGEKRSIKISYSKMYQYMHRVASSSVALPTDLWYPVSKNVKPQEADQIAIGFDRAYPKAGIFFSFEIYTKEMNNLIEYREGANLILNDNFEDQLLQGRGNSTGMEFLIRKEEGRFNGWLGYTISWSERQFEELNDGNPFCAKYDRRHYLSIVTNYQFKKRKRWSFSAIWEYTTGARFTALVGQYLVPNPALTDIDVIPVYTERNAVQMSPSHRLDINFVLKSKENRRWKWRNKWSGEWHFGFYNFYNRATPFRINVVPTGDGGYIYEQPGLFGTIPFVAYNFKV